MTNQEACIIISREESDGQYLSLLLSNHLGHETFNRYSYTPHNNAYYSHGLHLLFQKKSYDDSDIDNIRVLYEEGSDNRRLKGLMLSIEVLELLSKTSHFDFFRWIFIIDSADTLKIAERFIQQKKIENAHMVLNSALCTSPNYVLEKLSDWFSLPILNPENILPNVLNGRKSKINLSSIPENLIVKKFAVSVAFIYRYDHPDAKSFLEEHLLRIQSLEGLIKEVFIFSETNLTKELDEKCRKELSIRFLPLEMKMDDLLNEINEDYFLFDPLTQILPLKNWESVLDYMDKGQMVFTTAYQEDEKKEYNWYDLLSGTRMNGVFGFSKKDWQSTTGFDPNMDQAFQQWDLCLNILKDAPQRKAVGFKSKNSFAKTEQIDFKMGYQKVLNKYQTDIQSHMDAILFQMSEKHADFETLGETLKKLQWSYQHSNEELQALKHFSDQLQHRIRNLESGKYYRIKRAIGRYKKLFFRKKTPGSGNLKRILEFIRFAFSRSGGKILRKVGKKLARKVYLKLEDRPIRIVYEDDIQQDHIHHYDQWIKNKLERAEKGNYYDDFDTKYPNQPLISIIMPVYNPPLKYLKEAIESIAAQPYKNWELCIADDCSSEKKLHQLLHAYSVKDRRIKVHYRTENGHISKTSNDALSMAQGEYILLMDHDDLITRNALQEIIIGIHKHPEADIIYSDEDKIDENKHHSAAHFKPDWAPDHLLSRNYIGHVCVIRKSIMDEIGGFREGFEGSQDYDLLLRATEITQRILHIPKVLYHWRIHALSAAQGEEVKPYAYMAAKKALEQALLRRGMPVEVKYLTGLRGYRIVYPVQEEPMVSIIIPSKDQTELLKNTVDSILNKTKYSRYEIIVLNNNSTSKGFQQFVTEYSTKYSNQFRCVEAHFPFNFSKLMNMGRKLAQGKMLLLLNNDVEVIHDDWLEIMVSYTQQKRIGAVGVKLLYPDDTIQHAGVIVGLGGIAGHTFVGMHQDEPGYFNYIQSANNYSAVTAACLMVRADVYDAVGGMDEIFEVEYNDVDFCLRIQEAGYNNVYLPHVSLYHFESATRGHPHQSKSGYERHLKEMALFKERWQKIIDHDPYYNPNLNLGVHDFSMNLMA